MDTQETSEPALETADHSETPTESGYVQDLDFRSGVIAGQMPHHMAIVAAVQGYAPPAIDEFTYIDLCCGDGTTTNAIAALYPQAEVIGIDFNARHIDAAWGMAQACGIENARFIEADLTTLDPATLPAAEYIGINGAYSWLGEEGEAAVNTLLAQCLKPGGLFYVEYTSLPGKVSVQPLWGLIQSLTPKREGETSRDRAKRGLALTEALAKRGMTYLAAHRPAGNGARSYIQGAKQDEYRIDHFAHNAMADGFRPKYFTEMADAMEAAGLGFAGRTELALNEIEFSVPPAQVPTFQDYRGDGRTTELLKDYIRNEQQRRDVFVKSAEPDREAADAWLDTHLRLHARMPANAVKRAITTMGNHTIPLRGPAFEGLINAAGDGVAELPAITEATNLAPERIRRAALRLLATNQFFACRDALQPAAAEAESITLPGAVNRTLLERADERLVGCQLISPVTGGPALPLSPTEVVLIKAVLDAGSFDEAPERAVERLADEKRPLQGPRGRKSARDLTAEECREILEAFRGRKLINMQRIGIAG